MKKKIICLLGPTAVGKTEVAVCLAKKMGAEIISCDSMQIYKGIDIATSKPTKKDLRQVPHHLVDIIRPTQGFNAAQFRESSLELIRDIHKRGKVPLIVAGTGLYLRALLDGIFKGPGQDVLLRKKLYQLAQKKGQGFLYQKLKDIDSQAARSIHPHDLRRIIRAIEVYQKTKIPISQWKKKTCGVRDKYDVRIFGLRRNTPELYARIEKRVDKMFRQGLVAEIKKLRGVKLSRTAKSLLGYKEIAGFLEGQYSRREAKRLLKINTRHYAKRQITWFKREKGVEWLELCAKDTPKDVAERILRDVGNRQR